MCYGRSATCKYRFKIGDFAPTGPVDPKFQVRGHPHQPFFFLENWLNYLSYGIKIWIDRSSVLSKCTRWQTDRRMDRILIAGPRLHCMLRGKNVKLADKGVWSKSSDLHMNFGTSFIFPERRKVRTSRNYQWEWRESHGTGRIFTDRAHSGRGRGKRLLGANETKHLHTC